MKKSTKYILIFGLGAAAIFFYLRYNHGGWSMQHGHESSIHQHDEANMPGLQGKDTTEQEVSDLKMIFRSHKGITRSVSNLPNGIITTTEAADETLRAAIVSHVSMMVSRLEDGKNPEIIIQSPTLDALFEVYDQINTEIEMTDKGVRVVQTSSNADIVQLLQTHAAEVSDMASRGMEPIHERMKKSGH